MYPHRRLSKLRLLCLYLKKLTSNHQHAFQGDFSDIQKNLAFLKGYKTEGNISSQDITEAIPKSLQDNIFDMTQLLLRGQIQDVRELVHDLRLQGEDEIKLIAVMLGQFRTYLQVKLLSAQGKSEQQIV